MKKIQFDADNVSCIYRLLLALCFLSFVLMMCGEKMKKFGWLSTSPWVCTHKAREVLTATSFICSEKR